MKNAASAGIGIEADIIIDFRQAKDAYKFDVKSAGQGLKMVDFVVEMENAYLFIELKDPDNPASTPSNRRYYYEHNIKRNGLTNELVSKFKDSVIISWAQDKCMDKPIYYIVILEASFVGQEKFLSIERGIAKRLPFKLNFRDYPFKRTVIEQFLLMDMALWNKYFPEFPIYRKSKLRKENRRDFLRDLEHQLKNI